MSHRSDCPDRWEAEREGREEARWRSYPEREHYPCEEAQRSYEDGFRREHERREEARQEEEQREHDAYERRQQARRDDEAAEEAYYYEQRQREQQEPEPSERDLCESDGHAEYLQAVDRFGRRCYCGRVRYLEALA